MPISWTDDFYFQNAATRLFDTCVGHVVTKKSSMTHWHPVFGWYGQALDAGLQEAMPNVTQQLQLLWNGSTVKCLFSDLVNLVPEQTGNSPDFPPQISAGTATSSKNEKELAPSVRSENNFWIYTFLKFLKLFNFQICWRSYLIRSHPGIRLSVAVVVKPDGSAVQRQRLWRSYARCIKTRCIRWRNWNTTFYQVIFIL